MTANLISRRAFTAALTATAFTAIAGCEGSSMTPPQTPAELTIGFLLPTTGPYKAIGEDMLRGWNLFLAKSGGTLGGHRIKLVVADEGDGRAAARAAIDKLIKSDQVMVVVGTASADAVETIAAPISEAKVPFIGVGGRPSTLKDLTYIWHTSFLSTDYGTAVGGHLAKTVSGPVYVTGPNYQGGHDQIDGFTAAFTKAGGTLANADGKPAYTPWPPPDNYAPWLTAIRQANPAAVYAFAAGAPAVSLVKQYKEFGLTTIPLYGPGFLTEGAVLKAQADAANGIYTCAPYSPDLRNPANETFAAAVTREHQVPPNIYHVTAYDAAALLDTAIKLAGPNPSSATISNALGRVSAVDSPRGAWSFAAATHTPVQRWYLRQVQNLTGAGEAGRGNVVVHELGMFGG